MSRIDLVTAAYICRCPKLPCIKLQPWKILPTPEQNPKNAPECQVDRYTERLSIIYEHTYIEGIGQILHFANY